MATVAKGYAFSTTEQVTDAKLHLLVDGASISNIVNADIASAAAIGEAKINLDGSQIVDLSSTQTISGDKTFSGGVALKPRVNTVASSATPTINTDTTDMFTITALAADITSMTSSLSGTPLSGQKLIIRIKDDGTARAIDWGVSYASRGSTLPTTTVAGKYLYIGLIYNSVATVWDCIAVANE